MYVNGGAIFHSVDMALGMDRLMKNQIAYYRDTIISVKFRSLNNTVLSLSEHIVFEKWIYVQVLHCSIVFTTICVVFITCVVFTTHMNILAVTNILASNLLCCS